MPDVNELQFFDAMAAAFEAIDRAHEVDAALIAATRFAALNQLLASFGEPVLYPEIRRFTDDELPRRYEKKPTAKAVEDHARSKQWAKWCLHVWIYLHNHHPGYEADTYEVFSTIIEHTNFTKSEAEFVEVMDGLADAFVARKPEKPQVSRVSEYDYWSERYHEEDRPFAPYEIEEIDAGPIILPTGSFHYGLIHPPQDGTAKREPVLFWVEDSSANRVWDKAFTPATLKDALLHLLAGNILDLVESPSIQAFIEKPPSQALPDPIVAGFAKQVERFREVVTNLETGVSRQAELAMGLLSLSGGEEIGDDVDLARHEIKRVQLAQHKQNIEPLWLELRLLVAALMQRGREVAPDQWRAVIGLASRAPSPDWNAAREAVFLLECFVAEPRSDSAAEVWMNFEVAFEQSGTKYRSAFKRTASENEALSPDEKSVLRSWFVDQYLPEKAVRERKAQQKPEKVAESIKAAREQHRVPTEYVCKNGHTHELLGNAFCPTKLPSGEVCGQILSKRAKAQKPDGKTG